MDVIEESSRESGCPSRTTKLKEKTSAASLSFSIARLINGDVASASETSASAASAAAAAAAAAAATQAASSKKPVYPIPMWPQAPSLMKPAAPGWPFPGYATSLPATSAYTDPNFNAMLRHVLHNSGFPADTVAALVRHYQTLYGGAAAAAAANLHKVEILRSAAAAASLHHHHHQMTSAQLPAHPVKSLNHAGNSSSHG